MRYFFSSTWSNFKFVKERSLLLLLAVFVGLVSQAQIASLSVNNGILPAVFNVAGGSFDNAQSYHRFEWNFGELLLVKPMAAVDSSFLITHGVLQPCTDVITVVQTSVVFNAHEFRLFPNPTKGRFELNFFVREQGKMTLQLINAGGQTLEQRNFQYDGCCRIEIFDLSRYPAGTYLIVAELIPVSPSNAKVRHSGIKVIKF